MTDPITPTQADRDAAELFRRGFGGKYDRDVEQYALILARYRIAAEERGARWGIEAAIADVMTWYPGASIDKPGYAAAKALVASLRALDPKTICDSARETDRDPA